MRKKNKQSVLKEVLITISWVIVAFLLAAGALILIRSLVNKVFLVNYRNGTYSESPENLMSPMRFGENYVVPYNLGNVKYQQGDYETAAAYYYRALQSDPPEEEKECKIRINLALALLHNYPFDTMDMENNKEIEEALQVLYTARGVLTETGCADESFETANGHSEEAEKLKKDIDEMIKKLLAAQSQNDSNDNDDNKNGGGENETETETETETEPSGSPPGGDSEKEDQGGSEKSEEEQRQKDLQDQLKEQKQELEEGTYSGGEDSAYIYIDMDGEMSGYGEGVPW